MGSWQTFQKHCLTFGLPANFSKEVGEDELGFDHISAMSPSRTTIEHDVRRCASHKIIINGNRMLHSKAVYIGTDHGGGVLVKMAFFYDSKEKRVIKVNLDFDKADHDAKDGGKAVKYSTMRYSFTMQYSFTMRY